MKIINSLAPAGGKLLGAAVRHANVTADGWPFAVNVRYNLLELTPAQSTEWEALAHHTDSISPHLSVAAVYVERPLRWWHHAWNRLGGRISNVRRVRIEPDDGQVTYTQTWDRGMVHAIKIKRPLLFVSVNRDTGELTSSTGDVRVIGFELLAARQNLNLRLRD